MFKKIIATGIALAFAVSLSACAGEPETATVDESLTTMPDTTPLGVPGGTPGTLPPDTLGTWPDTMTVPPTTPTP